MSSDMTSPVPARPYTLIIRATERCAVGCDHCSISATPRGADLSLESLVEVLQEARRADVGLIHFSGGEPLLHADLERFVQAAGEHGFYAELTTSTFTHEGDNPSTRLRTLRDVGLRRVMLSYDASHARRVPIGRYAAFLLESLAQGIEVCACVVEWPESPWTLERVRSECESLGCEVAAVDWCRVGLSLVGRAARYEGRVSEAGGGEDARCPYVLVAPTLAPNGVVHLCPNVQSDSPLFTVGNVHEQPLSQILASMEGSALYRALSAHGPHGLVRRLSLPLLDVPRDMCRCCQSVLRLAERPEIRRRIEESAPPEGVPIPLDVDALLPGHRRFVLNEARPEGGCLCG